MKTLCQCVTRSSSLTGQVAARHRSEVTLAEIEEVIAFVIGDDKGWKIFHLDPPYSFHSKFRIFQNFNFFD